ncbi:ATP-binding protein [Nitratidesulfovibrio termitidis]|uniref:ATP-binding protein n=1 Tax=Nitratidesulfovibrio termitidis TaxID=42252 RepID=UPI000429A8BD|nr:ATP-binding protein [Nitratidesulfovibrio termitidis]
MSLTTNLSGRLRNTTLPRTHALLPLFEAVVNSIHACEDLPGKSITDGSICVHILREPKSEEQTNLLGDDGAKKTGPEALPEIVGFKIDDNGVGFNDENMMSFKELDSDYKEEKGCRGIGRLLWLKAFKDVSVKSSYFSKDGKIFQRVFTFDKQNGVKPGSPEGKIGSHIREPQTEVVLSGFVPGYRKYAPKTINKIAHSMLEHCLWYFIREGGRPRISLVDGDNAVFLDDLFDGFTLGNIEHESINIKGCKFELTYIKARNPSLSSHEVCYCAADRLVRKENITNKIPGLYRRISDASGQFAYLCFVVSPFLNERVRSERTGFDIEESKNCSGEDAVNQLGLFDDNADDEIVFDEINDVVLRQIATQLGPILDKNKEGGRKRVDTFVSTTAPKYKPILRHYPELTVDPDTSDKELDIILYKKLSDLEVSMISTGHDLSNTQDDEPFGNYKKRLGQYLAVASDIKKSDLASYVSHRKVVLDFFEGVIKRHRDGKYSQENIVHQLIMPMQVESGDIRFDDANLWLIDERLAFHNFLASDKTLFSMPITGATEALEPDIACVNIYDNPLLVNEGQKLPLASITVIEIKHPMRNDFSEGEKDNPIEQALLYVQKIRKGQVKTLEGRPIPQSEPIPAFCYILADLTPKMIERAALMALKPTSDYMGYFGYNDNYKAYIEVVGFDRLILAAKERNRAFFDKLGLPSN